MFVNPDAIVEKTTFEEIIADLNLANKPAEDISAEDIERMGRALDKVNVALIYYRYPAHRLLSMTPASGKGPTAILYIMFFRKCGRENGLTGSSIISFEWRHGDHRSMSTVPHYRVTHSRSPN